MRVLRATESTDLCDSQWQLETACVTVNVSWDQWPLENRGKNSRDASRGHIQHAKIGQIKVFGDDAAHG